MRVSGMTGSAVSCPALKAFTIGEHPSAWMTASLGMLVDQAHFKHFLEALIDTQRSQPAADGLDIPIRRAPAQLFDDLVGDGLHRFARGDRTRAAVQMQMPALGELRGDLLGLIVIAADADDLRAEQCRLAQLFLRNEAGHKDPQLDPGPGAGRRISHCGIARGSDHRFAHAAFIHCSHRDRGLPVFEGAGRAVAFILDVNVIMPERRSEALRQPERCPACGVEIESGGIRQRQDILIPPHVGRAVGQAAQDLALEGFVIVMRLQPLRIAVLADRRDERFIGLLFPAQGTLAGISELPSYFTIFSTGSVSCASSGSST